MTQLELFLQDDQDKERKLRSWLEARDLSDRAVSVLCLLALHGEKLEVNDQHCSRIAKSKYEASKLVSIAPNTYLAGVRDLEALGVVGVLRNTKPWSVVVNWSRVFLLPDRSDPVNSLPIFSDSWSTSVNVGQAPRDSVSNSNTNIRGITVYRDTCALTRLDQPWNDQTGFTGDELKVCVRSIDLKPLRHLYDEAVSLGWILDSEDAKQRFLTLCHHCATTNGINNPMAVLVSRVKDQLDCSRTRIASDEWARRVQKLPERIPDGQVSR